MAARSSRHVAMARSARDGRHARAKEVLVSNMENIPFGTVQSARGDGGAPTGHGPIWRWRVGLMVRSARDGRHAVTSIAHTRFELPGTAEPHRAASASESNLPGIHFPIYADELAIGNSRHFPKNLDIFRFTLKISDRKYNNQGGRAFCRTDRRFVAR